MNKKIFHEEQRQRKPQMPPPYIIVEHVCKVVIAVVLDLWLWLWMHDENRSWSSAGLEGKGEVLKSGWRWSDVSESGVKMRLKLTRSRLRLSVRLNGNLVMRSMIVRSLM